MRTGWAGLGGVSPIFFLLSPPTNPPEEIRLFSLALERLLPDPAETSFELERQELSPDEEALLVKSQRAARLIIQFEAQLRNYLHQTMTEHYGPGWEKSNTPENGQMRQRWHEKRAIAQANGEEASDLVQYADFTDYAKVITRGDNWTKIFGPVFRDKQDIAISFRRLEQLRVITLHSRRVTNGELLTIGTETSRILTAAGVIARR